MILAAVLIFNFGILAFLKYFGFCADSVHSLLEMLGISYTEPSFNFIVPLGISFYTFQSMGYVIDVYRGKVNAEKNFGKLALFVSFFPQIVQGLSEFIPTLLISSMSRKSSAMTASKAADF